MLVKKSTRRKFLTNLSSGLFLIAGAALFAAPEKPLLNQKFKMKFAPRGLFRASTKGDKFAYIKWLAEHGFTAVEGVVFCNPKKAYSKEEEALQVRIGQAVREAGLLMSNISSMNEKFFPTMTANQVPDKDKVLRSKKAIRQALHSQLEITLGTLNRIGSTRFIIGPGTFDKELSPKKQYENVVENMIFCADYCKRHNVVMQIEPLNTMDHPGMYCDRAALGASIARDVNNPHCRLLFDLYHEQTQVGNLKSLDDPEVWKYIESFHIADSPGRMEPGTGHMPYKEILKKIWDKGFRGFLGLEHAQSDKSAEGDLKLLKTYRELDSAATD